MPKNDKPTDMEKLTMAMRKGGLNGHRGHKGVYVPPGLSLDDELLILAGATCGSEPHSPSLRVSSVTRSGTSFLENKTSVEETVGDKYGHYVDYSNDELAKAELPETWEELNALGFFISDRLWRDRDEGDVVDRVVFSPTEHPDYPCWLPHHHINKAILEAHAEMFASERQAKDPDTMDTSGGG
ncbi:hypothetical protein K504DRAFT_462238 [Pleomassaria siparia CBS 279.74]|uniref:Uncharacterized protein n=1 Tax=Pleomassaria siparia CBS 279.74 TaxID=1314801 RepID=A0A6G1KMG1_9PLEO|nr:hypothetical protein K504DRAFT_462238 [Pleomassaria siparia CBS 279.74]